MSKRRRRDRRVPWLPALSGVGIVALGVVAVVFLFNAQGSGNVPSTSPIAATQESLAIGGMLYANNCQVCHGPRGMGSAQGADLTFHVPRMSDGAIFVRVRDGFPTDSDQKTMPAFNSELTETERWHLVNFLRDEFGEGAEPVLPDERSG